MGCADNINSLVTVLVTFVNDPMVTVANVGRFIESVVTHYPGLKVVVGVPVDFTTAFSKRDNVRVVELPPS